MHNVGVMARANGHMHAHIPYQNCTSYVSLYRKQAQQKFKREATLVIGLWFLHCVILLIATYQSIKFR